MSQNDWKWTSDDDLKMIRFFDQYLVTRNDETEKTIADPTTDPKYKYETKDDLENKRYVLKIRISSLGRKNGNIFEYINSYGNDTEQFIYFKFSLPGPSTKFVKICSYNDDIAKKIKKDFEDNMKIEDIFTKYSFQSSFVVWFETSKNVSIWNFCHTNDKWVLLKKDGKIIPYDSGWNYHNCERVILCTSHDKTPVLVYAHGTIAIYKFVVFKTRNKETIDAIINDFKNDVHLDTILKLYETETEAPFL